MRLRLELADDFPEQQKLLCDLREAEQLIRDGIAYAKNAHLCAETATPVDLRAFVESLVFDYQDTGRPVTTAGKIDGVIMLKPIALRRILSNFVDNALKYAGSAEVSVCRSQTGSIVIAVLDNGPGIACDKLESVKQPFVRLERDHFDGNGGTGLGLAIADQLANDMNAKLQLLNRSEGGLSAQIVFGLRTVSNVERLSTRVSAHCDVSRSASDMR
jgi:signal transduction histidine kinase